MKKLIVIAFLASIPSFAAADEWCDKWFHIAGRAMEMRQSGLPLDEALDEVYLHDLRDRFLINKLIRRAYEFPMRYTDNAKQASIEAYASAVHPICEGNNKVR